MKVKILESFSGIDLGLPVLFESLGSPVEPGLEAIPSTWWLNRRGSYMYYYFRYANTDYKVTKIHFYDNKGKRYSLPEGIFKAQGMEGTYTHVGFPGVSVKREKITEGFDWFGMFLKSQVFFVSTGKPGYTPSEMTRAELYIPVAYLAQMSYSFVERIIEKGYEVFTETILATPYFEIPLTSKAKDNLPKVKEHMKDMVDIQPDLEALRALVFDWENNGIT